MPATLLYRSLRLAWRTAVCGPSASTLYALSLLACCRLTAQVSAQTARPMQTEKESQSGLVRSRRLPAGLPLGGIGAGTFQLLTDGGVTQATITNNWDRPTGDLPACFAALWVRAGERTTVRALTLQSPYALPVIAGIDFEGLFPQARLDFVDTQIPASVTLRVFSPLVPQDLRSSAFPAAAFVFQVRNPLTTSMELSLALSWENILAASGSRERGQTPAQRIASEEGYFGLRFTTPPGTTVMDPAARAADNASGDMALMIRPQHAGATVTQTGWNAEESRPTWWAEFAQTGAVTERPMQKAKGRQAGVLAVHLTLKPGETADIPFAVAWYTPRLYTGVGVDYGHYYQRLYADSGQAARTLLADWRSLLSLTEEWQKRFLYSSLPNWMARRLINSVSVLVTHSLLTREGELYLLPQVGGVPPEGDVGIDLNETTAHVARRFTIYSLLLAFFPQLAAQPLDRSLNGSSADLSPWFWLQTAHYLQWTGDTSLVDRNWSATRARILATLRTASLDGRPLRRPAAPGAGSLSPPADALLRVSGLRAAGRLAQAAGDNELATQCERAAVSLASEAKQRFWNGSFLADHASLPGSAGSPAVCTTDQLLGQWAANLLGLSPVLAAEEISRTIASLHARNDMAPGFPYGPPLRMAANAKPPAEDEAAWYCSPAFSILADAAVAIQSGSPETGIALIERLTTARGARLGLLWQSPLRYRADTGDYSLPFAASLTHGVDWNLSYALAGFVWDRRAGSLTLAPQIPGPWRSLSLPLFTPSFWAQFSFKPTARGGLYSLRIDRLLPAVPVGSARRSPPAPAQVLLQSVRLLGLPSPAGARPGSAPRVHVTKGQSPIGFRLTRAAGGELLLNLEAPLSLAVGDRLEIEVH